MPGSKQRFQKTNCYICFATFLDIWLPQSAKTAAWVTFTQRKGICTSLNNLAEPRHMLHPKLPPILGNSSKENTSPSLAGSLPQALTINCIPILAKLMRNLRRFAVVKSCQAILQALRHCATWPYSTTSVAMPLWCKVEVNDKDNGHLSNLTKNCRETGKTLQLQVGEHWVERLLFGRSGQILWTWGSIYTCYIFEMFLETLPSSVHAGSSIKHVFPSINDTNIMLATKHCGIKFDPPFPCITWDTATIASKPLVSPSYSRWYPNAVSKIASGWLRIWNTQGISLCWDLVWE